MNVRVYKTPYGRVSDMTIPMDPEDDARVEALEARHIYPAVEILRTGEFSITLEADDLGEDLECAIVFEGKALRDSLRQMVRTYKTETYDARV